MAEHVAVLCHSRSAGRALVKRQEGLWHFMATHHVAMGGGERYPGGT